MMKPKFHAVPRLHRAPHALRSLRRVLALGLLAVLGVMISPEPGYGQGGRSDDMVLFPKQAPIPLLIGPELGYGWWKNEGSFTVSDGDRTCVAFSSGEGSGRTIGAKAMIYVTPWLFFSPRVRHELRSSRAFVSLPGESARDGSNNIVVIQQEGQADIAMSSIALDAMAGVEFFGLYIFGGGSMALMNDGTFDYSERLLGPSGFTYNDTRTREHTLIRNRPFDNYERSTFDLRAGGGYLLHLGPVVINPEAFYSMPMTSALRLPAELKQTGVVATVSIMYNLGD